MDLSEKDDEKIVFHIYILNSWPRKSQRQKWSASCRLTVTFAFNIPLLSDRALFLIGVLYQIFSHLDSNIIDVYISQSCWKNCFVYLYVSLTNQYFDNETK